jgi:aminopeptidase N
LRRATTAGRKAAYFTAIENVTSTSAGRARLAAIWQAQRPPPGLPLSPEQYTRLAEGLALRDPPNADSILARAERRITNPDELARFRFVRPAVSPREPERDSLFRSWRDPAVRRHESWVLEATAYLHHPLRAQQAEKYVGPTLDWLLDAQRTGDIFFPTSWIGTTLGGHQSAAVAETVARFIETHPDYPPRLRAKLYQAADELFRAARIVDGWRPAGATGLVLPAFPP